VLPVRVAGKCGADVADIIDGMRWAAGLDGVCKRSDGAGRCAEFVPRNPNPARIINISFGGSAACGPAYQAAIDELRGVVFAGGAVGAVVVASAGNGWAAPSRPANCQRVIGVAALNRDGFKTNYSAFGAVLALSTVGGDDADGAWGASLGANSLADSGILSVGNSGPTTPANCSQAGAECYFNHFGTSFSAPIVSGAVSLMLSVNPALSASQIEQGLARSARQ
jgi:serine protease